MSLDIYSASRKQELSHWPSLSPQTVEGSSRERAGGGERRPPKSSLLARLCRLKGPLGFAASREERASGSIRAVCSTHAGGGPLSPFRSGWWVRRETGSTA